MANNHNVLTEKFIQKLLKIHRKCTLVKSTTPPCIVFYQREKIGSLRDTSLTTNWKYGHFSAPRKASYIVWIVYYMTVYLKTYYLNLRA